MCIECCLFVPDTDDSTPVIIGAVASIILLFVIILGMLTVLFAIKSYNRKAVSLGKHSMSAVQT